MERMRARTTMKGRQGGLLGQHPYHSNAGPKTPEIPPRFGSDADMTFEERDRSTVKFKQSGFRITEKEKNAANVTFGQSEARRESKLNPSEDDPASPD